MKIKCMKDGKVLHVQCRYDMYALSMYQDFNTIKDMCNYLDIPRKDLISWWYS